MSCPPSETAAEQDADAPLTRDRFARELGDEWEPDGARHLPRSSGSGPDGDAFELHASQKPAVGSVEDD